MAAHPPRARRAGALAVLAAALLTTGCGAVGYYAQAVHGHFSLLAAGEPIPDLLAQPGALDPADRAALVRVPALRAFATEALGLPDNGSYRSFAALDREHAVWTVVAAPPFSLEPRTWCFPFAGCVSYRGYYREAAARAYAARLAARGDDVYVAGVPAYSTLGWLADPLPSTVLHWPAPRLAGLIFHELAHQVVYVEDDSAFNEAFATAVEREGVRRWLAAHGDAADRAAHRRHLRLQGAVTAALARARADLAALYGSGAGAAEMAARKAARLAALQAELGALTGRPEDWAELNNARLALAATYEALVPAFDALLAASGCDLAQFYRRAAALAERAPQARRTRLSELAQSQSACAGGGSARAPSGPRAG
jgi:predicted aminopeptidase